MKFILFIILLLVVYPATIYGQQYDANKIISMINSDDEEKRTEATLILLNYPDIVVPKEYLIKLLNDPHTGIQFNAMNALGNLRDASNLDIFKKAYSSNGFMIKESVLYALAKTDSDEGLDIVFKSIDNNNGLSLDAIDALGYSKNIRAFERLSSIITDKNNARVLKAINAIAKIDNDNVELILIKLLNSKSSEIRCAVVSALCEKKRSDAAIDLMINCLSDESIEVKRIVADNIYIQMDSRAVEPLINVLQDKDPQLKSNAIRSLKEIEDKRASPFVIKALDDPNLIVRESALGYFNRIYEPDVENKLLVMLDDKNYSTRRIVVSALRRFQDKKVIDILVEKIELEDEISVKDQYARTFKILNSKQAVIPLIKMLEDKKMTGRYHTDVIDALSSITKQQFGENTDAWKEWLKNNQNTLIETLKH